MKINFFVFLCLCSVFFPAKAEEKLPEWKKESGDFRGTSLNETMESVQSKVENIECMGSMCKSYFYISAGIKIENFFLFENNKLVSIHWDFSSSDFDFVKDVLIKKYDNPSKIIKGKVKTGAGVEHMNETIIWQGKKVIIVAEKFSGNINKSSVALMDLVSFEKLSETLEEKKDQATETF